jgi:dTDP-4-dehydrorhamnose reductase
VLNQSKPDIIINCAAIVDIDICEKNHILADALHVGVTKNLAKYPDSRFIYISTDSVFGGQEGDYRENDQTDPQNYYALSKLAGEQAALSENPNSIVLRTNIYGFHLPLGKSLAEWAIQNIQEKKQIQGFTDVLFNPLYTKQLAKIVKFMVNEDYRGIINIAADKSINKYEFLKKIAKGLGYSDEFIKKGTIVDFGLKAKRPRNSTLNISKILNRYPNRNDLSLEKGIAQFCVDFRKFMEKR